MAKSKYRLSVNELKGISLIHQNTGWSMKRLVKVAKGTKSDLNKLYGFRRKGKFL